MLEMFKALIKRKVIKTESFINIKYYEVIKHDKIDGEVYKKNKVTVSPLPKKLYRNIKCLNI